MKIKYSILIGYLLLGCLSACTKGFSSTFAQTATIIPTTSTPATTSLRPTATPRSATITPLPTRITPTVYPPEIPPENWQTVILKAYDLSLSIPPGWQVQTTSPENTTANTILLSSRQISGEGTNAACVLEANQPDLYGNYPILNRWSSNNSFYGCAIYPTDDSSPAAEGTLLIWYPYWVDAAQILRLSAPLDALLAIENSLQYQGEKQPWSGNSDLVPAECRLNKMPPELTVIDGLSFTKYQLTSSKCYQHMNVDSFAPLLPKEAVQKRQDLHNEAGYDRNQLNQQLAPFGYQIRDNLLYQDNTAQTKLLGWVGKPLFNATNTMFILPYTESNGYSYAYFSNQALPGSQDFEFYSSLGYVPRYAFLGDDLLWLRFDTNHLAPVGSPSVLQLFRNDELIFEYSVMPSTPASVPPNGLYTWNGHWYLEVNDILIRDGKVLNQELGFSEMFTFQVINEQPFYFFRQGEQIHVSYAGKTLPQTFQSVIHEPSCCSGGQVNMTRERMGLDSSQNKMASGFMSS